MIDPAVAQARVKETLVGFPPGVVEAYLAYAARGELASLDAMVLGVLGFYLAKKPAEPLDTLPGTTRLAADLGCDSLAMMDMVFAVESLLDVKLEDDELAKIVTLDDLRAYLRSRVGTGVSTAA